MKRSWTPISLSGFHPIVENELTIYFVDDFEPRYQPGRRYMVSRLSAYLHDLSSLGLSMEIWLDGSFTTRCPEPNDIDLVVLLSYRDVERLAHAEQLRLNFLLNERERLRIRYACDVYHADINDEGERQRWIQQFATNHDDTPKGIFTLIL